MIKLRLFGLGASVSPVTGNAVFSVELGSRSFAGCFGDTGRSDRYDRKACDEYKGEHEWRRQGSHSVAGLRLLQVGS